MKLTSIELINIRSHVRTVVNFGDGFNCLVGGLGQGKSSVLYAFDFALFGDRLGRSYDYLLREDSEEGRVVANFVHNGKTYSIQRALRRRANSISQDTDYLELFQDGKPVADNKNDAVAEQLKAYTGLDKNIFRELFWVRQEHLKELIDTTPRQRQTKIDELFELSNYELAWDALKLFKKTYEVEKSLLEKDVDVMRVAKLEADYCKAVEDFSTMVTEIEDTKAKLETSKLALDEATYNLDCLEELQKTTEALQRRKVKLQTNLTNIKRRLNDLTDQKEINTRRLNEQEKQVEELKNQKKLYLISLTEAGIDNNKPLQELRKYLFDVEEQLRTFSGEQQATKREMQASADKISAILKENKCPRCLQEVSGDYKQSLKDNLEKEQVESQKLLAELQTKLEKLKSHHRTVDVAVSGLQQLVPRIEDLENQIAEKQEYLSRLSSQLEDAKQEQITLEQQLTETQEEISKFDVSQLESARKLQNDAFANHLNAKNQVAGLERRKTDLSQKVDDLKERLDIVQSKVERKENVGRLLEIIDRLRIAYRSIQPKLRSEFVKYLQISVQNVLDSLTGEVGPVLNVKIDKDYSPYVSSEEGYDREVANLSGGERTLLAFAYRIGLGQLIMQARTGQGLHMLLLDEPTESLGREDGSVERLAEAVSRLRSIEQIIAVTHNESFAEKADHVIRIQKENGESKVFLEK